MRKRKIGLALGSGAARGLAHIGVLKVLQKENIPIDMIAGVSAGAAVGALYASGIDISQIKKLALDLSRRKLVPFVDPSLPKTGLIKGKKIKEFIMQSIGGDIQFSDLKIPFACVATDINTGDEVIIDSGSVPEAVRASISIPVIFTVVKRDTRHLVDGGLVNPVPVDVIKRMGADFVIAVNVIPDVSDRTNRVRREHIGDSIEPNIINVMMQSIYIATYSLVKSSLEEADIVIEPRLAHIGSADFHHAQELILLGQQSAQESITAIRNQLKIRN